MNETTRKSMSKSTHAEWCTPKNVLTQVAHMGPVALDPCSNSCSTVAAKRAITLPQDGLKASWAAIAQDMGGIVFVNPPYGRQVKLWVQKCAEEAKQGAEIILLCAARVDTKWFQEFIFTPGSAVVCFWKGRIKFVDARTGVQGDPSFFPSALIYWGPNKEKFIASLSGSGYVVDLGHVANNAAPAYIPTVHPTK